MTTATKLARLAHSRRMKLLDTHGGLVAAVLRTAFLSPDDVVVLADPASDPLARLLVRGESPKACVVSRAELHATFGRAFAANIETALAEAPAQGHALLLVLAHGGVTMQSVVLPHPHVPELAS